MPVISSVHITGFWGDRDVTFDLNDKVNFLIGQNGSGKTTAINLIAAAMTGDTESLNRLPFENISISLYDNETRRRPSISVSKTRVDDFVYPEITYKIKETSSGPVQQYPFVHYPDERRPRSEPPFRMRSGTRTRREYRMDFIRVLTNLAQVSWLSVHRTTVSRHPGERPYRDHAVDQKLQEISDRLVRYFSELSVHASTETRNFQRKFFLSLIEDNQDNPSLSFLLKQDLADDREALTDIYRRFEVPESQYMERTTNFFSTLKRLKTRDLGDGFSLQELILLINSWRVHSLVEEWVDTVEKEKEALMPRESFLEILNRMFHRKNARVLDNNEIAFVTTSEKTLTAYDLSSGEKQLYIILAEALLQRGNSCIYIADEPELSLHINWQEILVDSLKELNPRSQIVFATHSPDIVSHYSDRVINMEEIVS